MILALGAIEPATSSRAAKARARLLGRAILAAELPGEGSSPAPAPFPAQPVGGFSALLADRAGAFWALTDNGYGSKANSRDFLLRVYRVRPDFETQTSGSGRVSVGRFVQLRDPNRKVPFPIVTQGSTERLLTGADFDPESMRIDARGHFWFGDEFGPYLIHTDASGKLLEAPIPLPGLKSPDNPTLGPNDRPGVGTSSGFEGLAISADGRYLYPMLERALSSDPDQRRRYIYKFDLRRGRYTKRRWQYRTHRREHVIGELTRLDRHRLLVIERDFRQGEQARFARVFVVDLRRADRKGFLVKRAVVDLLNIRDPALISRPARPGDIGLGDPFKFPYLTIESVLPLMGRRLALVNDNNLGGTNGRNRELPDYSDFIAVRRDV